MTTPMQHEPSVIGYLISDASGNYDTANAYPDYASALQAIMTCDGEIGSGETIGAVMSDGTVTFEI